MNYFPNYKQLSQHCDLVSHKPFHPKKYSYCDPASRPLKKTEVLKKLRPIQSLKMATPGIAHRPTDINTNINPSNPNVSGVAHTPLLTPAQVTPSHNKKAEILEPRLLNQEDFATIRKQSPSEQNFWRSQYRQAKEAQKNSSLNWKVFCEGLQIGENEQCLYATAGFAKFDEALTKYEEAERDTLTKINERIDAHNVSTANIIGFGMVEVLPLREPLLVDQDLWQTIADNRLLHGIYSKAYSSAYALQLYRNAWMGYPPSYTQEHDATFITAMKKINEQIKEVNQVKIPGRKRQPKPEFGFINVPEEGKGSQQEIPIQNPSGEENDGTSEEEEEEARDDMDEDNDDVPQEVQQIRAEMGGKDSVLRKWILAKQNGDEKKMLEYRGQLDSIQGRVGERAMALNYEKDYFNIDLDDIKVMNDYNVAIVQSKPLLDELSNNPKKVNVFEQYQEMRTEAEKWVCDNCLPENFVDVITPEVKEHPDIIALHKLLESIGGADGPLNHYLYSTALGKVDTEANQTIADVKEQMVKLVGAADVEKTFTEMIADVKKIKGMEIHCRRNVSNKNLENALHSEMALITNRYVRTKRVQEALSGDIISSGRFRTPIPKKRAARTEEGPLKPKPTAEPELTKAKRKNKKSTVTSLEPSGLVEAPGAEDDEADYISTNTEPGIVVETVSGQSIRKRIVSWRKSGYGYQLLLKSTLPKFTKPAYEFVRASDFKGARAEFINMGGGETSKGARKDLTGVLWSECLVGGVASVRRDEDDVYMRHARTLIRIYLKKTKVSNWFTRSDLQHQFGNQIVASEAEYLKLSGQAVPKEPMSRIAIKKLMFKEERRRQRGEESEEESSEEDEDPT